MKFHKYSGAGNTFLITDGRRNEESLPASEEVSRLCRKAGVDGLMALLESEDADFRMVYYNSDGSSGMMCGNGGRCIAAFADSLGIRPANGKSYVFEAPDGLHEAEILSREGGLATVRLSMRDPEGFEKLVCEGFEGCFVNTGTRHFVTFVEDVENVDVAATGASLRRSPIFAPEGVNVNFVSSGRDGRLHIRTFEKGVEAETLACGTGITAAAIVSRLTGIAPTGRDGERVRYVLSARIAELAVEFIAFPDGRITAVTLEGPAERIL